MTTKTWDFTPDHQNDAGFRAWGKDLSDSIAQVGMVKTADTGQIDWTTVLRPAVNTFAGYEIWRFVDSSVFIKLWYGSAGTASVPMFSVQVGTGSNGSGTLTGVVSSTRNINGGGSTTLTGSTVRRNYICRDINNTFFGFAWGQQSPTSENIVAIFCVARTVDANTLPTNQGAFVYWSNNTANPNLAATQGLDFQNNLVSAVNTSQSFCNVPFDLTTSTINGVPQFFTHWFPLSALNPRIVPVFPMCTVITAEINMGLTFQAAPIGAGSRTFLALPNSTFNGATNGGGTYRLAMLFD